MPRVLLFVAIAFTALTASDTIGLAQVRPGGPSPLPFQGQTLYRTFFQTPQGGTTLCHGEDSSDNLFCGCGNTLGPWEDLVDATVVSCPANSVCTAHVTSSFGLEDRYGTVSVRAFLDDPSNLAWPYAPSKYEDDLGVHITLGAESSPLYPVIKHHTLQFVKDGVTPGFHTLRVQGRLTASFDCEGADLVNVSHKVARIDVLYR